MGGPPIGGPFVHFRVFLHSYLGFRSTSTLFYGERDAILIDATQLLSDAHLLAAELILMRKNLTHIYVSHFHPDHHFGLGVLKDAFPRAKIVALPERGPRPRLHVQRQARHLVHRPVRPRHPGHHHHPGAHGRAPAGARGRGDCSSPTTGRATASTTRRCGCPSARILCATDIAFDDWNVWFIESNVERRAKWRVALDRLKEFDARVVIPGHGSEKTMEILERAAADPSFEYTSCVDWTREYIDFYEDVYQTAHIREPSSRDRIRTRYPEVKGNDFAHRVARPAPVSQELPGMVHAPSRRARQHLLESFRAIRRRSAAGVELRGGKIKGRRQGMDVGFIGLGQMGAHMARHVADAGFGLVVNDSRQEAAAPLVAAGARWADTPAEVAETCRMVITCLPSPASVEEVALGPSGLVRGVAGG